MKHSKKIALLLNNINVSMFQMFLLLIDLSITTSKKFLPHPREDV